MADHVALIGFGEAAMAFVEALGDPARFRAYDIKTEAAASCAAKAADYAQTGVCGTKAAIEAVAGASLILSLVTPDQALAAAGEVSRAIPRDAIYCDLNSVAPQTKRAAAAMIEENGGLYADVAVMAPVLPARNFTPLLVSGPHKTAAARALRELGFTMVEGMDGPLGSASAIKMIRSIMVKGVEALSLECMLAAHAAGVMYPVIASLDASWQGAECEKRADYNIERMMAHGLRRAAELEEVVKTLDELGTGSAMTKAAAERQRAIGSLRLSPPEGLAAKLALVVAEGGRR